MDDLVKDTTVAAASVIGGLAVNYIKGAVMGVVVPLLTDALKEAFEDAKEEVKGQQDEKGDPVGRQPLDERLWRDEKEPGVDTNILSLRYCPTQNPWIGNPWTGYQLSTVKIGTDRGDEKKPGSNKFYAVGYDVILRHSNMVQLDQALRKDYPEAKLEPLPPDCVHGTKCFCMVRTVDSHSQEVLMKKWMGQLVNKPFCHSLSAAKLFRIGPDYEKQAMLKAVFDQAVIDTVEDKLGRPACKWCEFRDPFDEAEAVRQLLYLVLVKDVIPKIDNLINPPVCAYNARMIAQSTILGVLDTAAAGWASNMSKVNDAKDAALKAIEDASGTLVEKLKPHLIKIADKIKPKLGGDKKVESGPVKEKMGDITFKWQFRKTGPGSKLWEAMGSGMAKPAISAAEAALNPRHVIDEQLKGIAEAIGGEGMADVPGIKDAIRELSGKINDQIYRFNTLRPLLEAVQSLAHVRDLGEDALSATAGKPEAVAEAIAAQSLALWDKGLTASVLKLFEDYTQIRTNVKNAYGGDTPEKAATAMIDYVDYLFQNHVRALNAVRVRYANLLKEWLADPAQIASADLIKQHSKNAFRQAFFEVANILVDDFWVKMCDNIVLYACCYAFQLFQRNIWNEMKELLDALASVLPDPVAKANVHEAIIKKVIEVGINKVMTFITTKILIWAEKKLFTQEE